jgi:hypothetical protein
VLDRVMVCLRRCVEVGSEGRPGALESAEPAKHSAPTGAGMDATAIGARLPRLSRPTPENLHIPTSCRRPQILMQSTHLSPLRQDHGQAVRVERATPEDMR